MKRRALSSAAAAAAARVAVAAVLVALAVASYWGNLTKSTFILPYTKRREVSIFWVPSLSCGERNTLKLSIKFQQFLHQFHT